MASLPKVINVVEEKNGSFTATIHVVDDAGNVLSKHQVNAVSKADFKTKIRPHLQRFLQAQTAKETLVAVANDAITELIAELGY